MARLAIVPLVLLLCGGSAIELFCQFACAPSRIQAAGCHHATPDDGGPGVLTSTDGHGCDHSIAPATLAGVRLDAQPVAGSLPSVAIDRAPRAFGVAARLRGSPPGSSLPTFSVLRI